MDAAELRLALANARLYTLAQANALLRLYREHNGRDAASVEEVTEWAERIGVPLNELLQNVKPTDADYRSKRKETTK